MLLYQNYVFHDYQGYISDLLYYTLDHIDGDDLKASLKHQRDRQRHVSSFCGEVL